MLRKLLCQPIFHLKTAQDAATSLRSNVPQSLRLYCAPCSSDVYWFPNKIGTREVVGFGVNGKAEYLDSFVFPYPAIRFREITPDYKALQEKEKGSWKVLTINEKKCLYRISFCQTVSEVAAPSGDWKKVTGTTLMLISLAIWFHMFLLFMTREELPETFSLERQRAQLKRIIDLRMNPITGISSKWDYENNNWKGKGARGGRKEEGSTSKN